MTDPNNTPFGLTIRDALNAAMDQGYDQQFVAGPDATLERADTGDSVSASSVEVRVVWRIEGTSDAADQIMVAAVEVPGGARGTVLLSYGPSASEQDNNALAALDLDDAEPGLPPETPPG